MKKNRLSDLFDITYGTKLDMNKMSTSDASNIAFVSRSSKNNGIVGFVDRIESVQPLEAGLITVSLGGTYVLSSFLQTQPFFTAQNVAVLKPKVNLTTEEKLYYCLCISRNRFRYSAFGREANRSLKTLIVPSPDEIPIWVKQVDSNKYTDVKKSFIRRESPVLEVHSWGLFRIGDLFDLKKGKRLTKANLKHGSTPFIAAIDNNNGCREMVAQPPIHDENTITVNYNGSVAEAFYQERPYYASDDVNVLYPRFELNKYIALFIISIIKKEKFRFNYGRKWHLERMELSMIKLPCDISKRPDFHFMEEYIKTLDYSGSI